MDTEQRLQRIEDRLAIQDLVSSYGILLDNRDYEAVGEMFTEDARFRQHVGDTDVRTREGIKAFYRERLADCGPSYHYHHGHVVDFDDDQHAHGIVTAHAEMGIEGRMILVGLRYHDAYVKGDDGRWRFTDRETWFHYFMPADELPARYSAEIRRTWPGSPLPADLPESLATYQNVPHAPASG
jgi:ketosteroid isomerase-like protein